ncbi:acyl-CoA dehydrogenase [Colwellia demingiae]|uniref:Acyl-CoA dehydrogenase n=1 Tax=Colwellia demingiae TaxID=89401 RepID=A0A5C6QGB6_9GAMM|nr:acyl-CoA dehydrogenase [Colwellia demingiae]TWX68086.1 acyl-CoA dehydrogenase [Colwellia demingiae]
MSAKMLNERDLSFMLYELFDVEKLITRERFKDHDKESFNAAVDTAKVIAEKYFLPIRKKIDQCEPTFDGSKVTMIPEIKPAIDSVIQAGLAAPASDYDAGGMQLPEIVANTVNAYLIAAASTTLGYVALTNANCNLIEAHGSEKQIKTWVKPMREGRFMGTMAMTEPEAGSGLADLTTTAIKQDDDYYLISGNKIFISGGDHELSDNIVHLVLGRVKGAPKGIKGITLFIVPKYLVNDDTSLGQRNDVNLTGLFHKMGGRGQTSTALNFGEKGGAIGYLVGEENMGLTYMFHMMNEARIMVGSSAAITAMTGYQYSLDYAKERRQGRLLSCKDPKSTPVNIIQHPDVRRMLLTQKAYAEGAWSLCLFGSLLSDNIKTAENKEERQQAQFLLDFLTPMIKSWPSEWGPKANSLAIQVLGGHGYINEHPVEMFYRDNRLNPIHEGSTGIQSLDLMTRKISTKNSAGYIALLQLMQNTIEKATGIKQLASCANELNNAIAILELTTKKVLDASSVECADLVFSNSVTYLDMFGHIVISWLWLKQGMSAIIGLAKTPHQEDKEFYLGKLQAMKFFYRIELPKTYLWASIVENIDDTHFAMQEAWF